MKKKTDILTLNLFNNIKDHKLGELIRVGTDEEGREIFVIGSKKSGKVLAKTLDGISQIYGFSAGSILFVDLNHLYNYPIRLGIFLIKRLKLVSIGKKLVVLGIWKNHEKLRDIVQNVRDKPVYKEKEAVK